MPVVEIPYKPRSQQRAIHQGIDSKRFSVVVCHRRFGKSVMSINHLQRGALTCTLRQPRFAYIGPTYRQAKQTVWEYAQYYSSAVPGRQCNQSELRIDYPNGGQLRLYGADNPDSLRGLYFDGVICDEYGMMQSNLVSEVLRPALADRQGWLGLLGTPNGHNQFYEAYVRAQDDPAWYLAVYKASQTGIIPQAELESARAVMTADEYQQEFECSFEAAIKGAIYAKEIEAAESAQRITSVPYDPLLPVDTDWDLGVGDHTAIWFSQSLRSGEVRVIDYLEDSGEGLPYYVKQLHAKPYVYGQHWAPHDIQVREFASGRSRKEVAQSLGLNFNICPKVPVEDGIHAARMLFPRVWFDKQKCKAGLEALKHYRRDYNSRLQEFKATPVHDIFSHGADAFRYLATRQEPPGQRKGLSPPMLPPNLGPHGWMGY